MDGTAGWLNNLKLRASVGSLGNGQINPYLFNPIMSVRQSSGISINVPVSAASARSNAPSNCEVSVTCSAA